MITENYINCLKTKNRAAYNVALRQALCYYLYKENVPCTIISSVFRCTRRYVYAAIYRVKDLLEVGDKLTRRAVEEINAHKIRIVPITAEGDLLSMHVGYRMIIDNVIY